MQWGRGLNFQKYYIHTILSAIIEKLGPHRFVRALKSSLSSVTQFQRNHAIEISQISKIVPEHNQMAFFGESNGFSSQDIYFLTKKNPPAILHTILDIMQNNA